MENKTLFVSGASSDVGCEIIQNLAGDYDCILAHYYHMNDKLSGLKNQLGDRLELLQANFMDADSTKKLAQEIAQRDIHHFIHLPAQKLQNIKFAKCDWESYEREISVSMQSAVELLKAMLPKMAKAKYGKVIFMLSSCTINTPPKYLGSYVPVKYALLGLMKSLSAEYAQKGIAINGISPEMMETKFLTEIADLVVESNAQNSPVGRNLLVGDVIPTVKFLLSDGADLITGQNIAITGGR